MVSELDEDLLLNDDHSSQSSEIPITETFEVIDTFDQVMKAAVTEVKRAVDNSLSYGLFARHPTTTRIVAT